MLIGEVGCGLGGEGFERGGNGRRRAEGGEGEEQLFPGIRAVLGSHGGSEE